MPSGRCLRLIRLCGARKSARSVPTCSSMARACRRSWCKSCRSPNRAWAERRAARPERQREDSARSGGSALLAGEVQRLRRIQLGQASESDHALPLDLQAVTPDEGFLAVVGLHERAVGALIDQHELAAVDLDARMQPGN